jgi:hypothetical protein
MVESSQQADPESLLQFYVVVSPGNLPCLQGSTRKGIIHERKSQELSGKHKIAPNICKTSKETICQRLLDFDGRHSCRTTRTRERASKAGIKTAVLLPMSSSWKERLALENILHPQAFQRHRLISVINQPNSCKTTNPLSFLLSYSNILQFSQQKSLIAGQKQTLTRNIERSQMIYESVHVVTLHVCIDCKG